jgi:RNA polymerase sigma-70 factor (ECF subfamily)
MSRAQREVAPLKELDFGRFYERTARPLWSYVYRVTRRAADADDIVQDAFCRLLRADVGGLDDDELRRYVFRIAGNLMTDRWRRAERETSWLARLRGASHEKPDALPVEPMARELAALAPRDRALLWLAYVEEQNHQEIAGALGLARGSVKVLLSRARARLRRLLVAKGMTVVA